MKHLSLSSSIIFSIVFTGLFLASTAKGTTKTGDIWFKGSSIEAIEQNLAFGLNTRSPGVHASASQVIRDLKALFPYQDFSLLIIPLMRIVKDEDAETPVRMVAALALHELNSQRGDFAIQRLALFTSNKRMRHLCSWLAYDRAQHATPATSSNATTSN